MTNGTDQPENHAINPPETEMPPLSPTVQTPPPPPPVVVVQQQQIQPQMQPQKKKVNHILHFILTILTFGLWLPVWIVLAIKNS